MTHHATHADPVRDERDTPAVGDDVINAGSYFAMYSVFAVPAALPAGDDAELARAATDAMTASGATIRGFYDVSGFRGDADLMTWTLADDPRVLQAAYQGLRRSELGSGLVPVWSVVGTHRPAEFNRSHVPSAINGFGPRPWLTVYPFVRSYDWYVLDADERSAMLREHGMAGREYPEVLASTLSTFALSDYEWVLAFESDNLTSIVDVMRRQRATQARRHVREETPFFTGPRVELASWIASQPRA